MERTLLRREGPRLDKSTRQIGLTRVPKDARPPSLLEQNLFDAIAAGDLVGIRESVEKGADVNFMDFLHHKGRTPLHAAVQDRRLDVLELLHDLGGRLDVLDSEGRSLLHWIAGVSDGINVLEFLLGSPEARTHINLPQHRSGFAPLHIAARYDQLESTNALLRAGADPNLLTRSGETPLHLACRLGFRSVAEALLRGGADLEATTALGQTPLALAVAGGHTGVARLLQDAGPRSLHEPVGWERTSALGLSRRYGHPLLGDTLAAEQARRRAEERRRMADELARWEREEAERRAREAEEARRRREEAMRARREAQDAADREFLRRAEKEREEEARATKRALEEENRLKALRVRAARRKNED